MKVNVYKKKNLLCLFISGFIYILIYSSHAKTIEVKTYGDKYIIKNFYIKLAPHDYIFIDICLSGKNLPLPIYAFRPEVDDKYFFPNLIPGKYLIRCNLGNFGFASVCIAYKYVEIKRNNQILNITLPPNYKIITRIQFPLNEPEKFIVEKYSLFIILIVILLISRLWEVEFLFFYQTQYIL